MLTLLQGEHYTGWHPWDSPWVSADQTVAVIFVLLIILVIALACKKHEYNDNDDDDQEW